MPGIFLISSERSGSNLLKSMLGGHSKIAAPPAQHLFKNLTSVLPLYGDIKAEGFRELVEDTMEFVNVQDTPFSWDCRIGVEEVLEDGEKQRNLTEVICNTYAHYAKNLKKDHWVCKENDLFDFTYNILYHYPKSKFIYLVRDGRDVAASEKKIRHRNRHIFLMAEQWHEEQEKGIVLF